MTEFEKHLQEENKRQAQLIEELTTQIQQLNEQIKYMTKKLFGTSSEKSKVSENQLSIFEENNFLMKQRQLKKKPSK